MRTYISVLIILIFLTGCGAFEESCGERAQSCCEGRGCSEGLVCNNEGKCVECGGFHYPCCEGNTCSYSYGCGKQGYCTECGEYDEPCCVNNTCKEGFCGETGRCEMCGGYYQPCCKGSQCSEGYACGSEGECTPIICGSLDQNVCEGNICNGWLVNRDGVCRNPFALDKHTDSSICENGDGSQCAWAGRDFCYWFAAYYLKQTSLCNNIGWEEMRDTCRKGGNPRDYTTICTY